MSTEKSDDADEPVPGMQGGKVPGPTPSPDWLARSGDAASALRAGLALSDLSLSQLWLEYRALGGIHGEADLSGYINGHAQWSAREYDVAAHALNEDCAGHYLGYPVLYADELSTL